MWRGWSTWKEGHPSFHEAEAREAEGGWAHDRLAQLICSLMQSNHVCTSSLLAQYQPPMRASDLPFTPPKCTGVLAQGLRIKQLWQLSWVYYVSRWWSSCCWGAMVLRGRQRLHSSCRYLNSNRLWGLLFFSLTPPPSATAHVPLIATLNTCRWECWRQLCHALLIVVFWFVEIQSSALMCLLVATWMII